jgi:ferredoxin
LAYLITDECTACGICPQACPNDAIVAFDSQYHIEPLYCTECVGYSDAPQCAQVCAPGAIVPAAPPQEQL